MGLRSLAAAALVALIAVAWLAAGRGADETQLRARDARPPGAQAPPAGLLAPARVEARAAAELMSAPPAPAAALPPAGPARLPVERPRAALVIAVVDPAGSPLSGVRVRASPSAGTTHDLLVFDDGRGPARSAATGADGRATLADLALGGYWVAAERDGRRARARVHHAEGPAEPHSLVLDPARAEARLAVRVVDPERRPVAGAVVRLYAEVTPGALETEWARTPAGGVTAEADAQGTALFDDPGFEGAIAVATAPDGRSGSATLWMADAVARVALSGLEVVVGPPASLAGELSGLPPAELAGARVEARLLDNAHPHYTTHAAPPLAAPVDGGRYRFESLPAGVYTLSLADPGGARLVLPPLTFGTEALANSLDPVEVALQPGERAVRDLAVARGAALAGDVRTIGGEPVAGAVVRATLTPHTSNFPDGFTLRGANVWRFDSASAPGSDHPESHPRTTTDRAGRYLLLGLQPGRWRVEVAAPGLSYEVRPEVALAAGATVQLEHVLAPAGAIQGVRRLGSYLGVTRAGEALPRMVAIVPHDGLFAFPGLEAGRYVLSAFHSDAGIEPVPLTTVAVEAGRTTWVDVDRVADVPVRVRGRVVDRAGPVAGARVRFYRAVETTGADGRFEHRAAFHIHVAPEVEVGPLHLGFELGVTGPGAEIWEGDLALGDERLQLVARDALERPTTARVSLEGQAAGRPELVRVAAPDLEVPEQGELALDGLPAGTYALVATFPDGSQARLALTLPCAEPVLVRAPSSGDVAVLVRSPDGRPAPGLEVLVATWSGPGAAPLDRNAFLAQSTQRSARTGADGRALLRGVTAGTLHVEAYDVRGYFREYDAVAAPPVPRRLALEPGARAELVLDVGP